MNVTEALSTEIAPRLNQIRNESRALFDFIHKKLFNVFYANGTLHTTSDLLAPTVKKIHEFFLEDQGFLGEKFAQFVNYATENPYSLISRVLVFGTGAYLAKYLFTVAWYPRCYRDPMSGVIYEKNLSFMMKIPLYFGSFVLATIAGYEVITALSGRATCVEGFHDCIHPLWS